MPIKIPDDLPARKTLEEEGVLVIGEHDAIRQDIRPIHIAVLNLMPEKIKTETQLSRLVGATPLQVEMTLLKVSSYEPRNTSREHMLAFYQPWEDVKKEKFDGLIITGAPVEEIDFEEVDYWPELQRILDWAETNVHTSFNICWGGQAALYHYHGVPKHLLGRKLSGVYQHRVTRRNAPIMRGFNDVVSVPVSRYTEIRRKDVDKKNALEVLLESDEAGISLIQDRSRRAYYMFNHLEYDTRTLSDEYNRDVKARAEEVHLPEGYFPADNPGKTPTNTWRAHGHLLISNWINETYQTSPYDLSHVGNGKDRT